MSMSWDDFPPDSTDTPAQSSPVPPAGELTYASFDEIKNIPQKELYRLIVDGQFHSEQQGWLGYAKREFNCLPACFHALAFALTNIDDTTVSVNLIKKIHSLVTAGVKKLNAHTTPGELRFSHGGFFLELEGQSKYPFMNKPGFLQLHKKVNEEHGRYGACLCALPKKEAALLFSEQYYDKLEAMENTHTSAENLWKNATAVFQPQMLFYRAPSAMHLNKLLEEASGKYQADINHAATDEEKLKVIITLIQHIEQLHAFPDANGRTSVILLQRLLVQNGFFPAMLYNPNYIDGHDLDTLTDEIKKGIYSTKSLVQHPDEPLYDYKTVRFSLSQPFTISASQQFLHDTIKNVYLAEEKLYQFIQSQHLVVMRPRIK